MVANLKDYELYKYVQICDTFGYKAHMLLRWHKETNNFHIKHDKKTMIMLIGTIYGSGKIYFPV